MTRAAPVDASGVIKLLATLAVLGALFATLLHPGGGGAAPAGPTPGQAGAIKAARAVAAQPSPQPSP